MSTLQPDNVERLLRFDTIRLSKLLEMIQDGIIIFILAFYLGSAIDKLCGVTDEKMTNTELWGWIILQLVINIVAIYYVRKVAEVIPFMLSLNSNYVSNKKGEVDSASGFVASIIFISIQKNFGAKLSLLKARYALNY
jgi:hypothetical protein